MDASAPLDDLHQHPDFDAHIHREGGQLKATVWIFGTRHELEEVEDDRFAYKAPLPEGHPWRAGEICPLCEKPEGEHILHPDGHTRCPA